MTRALLKPIITERSIHDAGRQWYTFAVLPSATKHQIQKAVEKQFGVTVLETRTQIVKNKTHRVGKKRQEVQKSLYKKARVKLEKDQKIDLFEVQT